MNDLQSKWIKILVGLCLISVGSYISYFISYKNNDSFDYSCYFLDGLGWLFIFSVFFGSRFSNLDKNSSLGTRLIGAIVFISFVFIVVANMTIIKKYGDERVNDILNNQPTDYATAEVVRIDKKTTKNGRHIIWAIIQYKAQNIIVKQVLRDNQDNYYVGQMMVVQYSIEYPDMFVVK